MAQLVVFARRSRHHFVRSKLPARFRSIIAAKIHRFANFCNAVINGLAGVARQEIKQLIAIVFQQVRRFFQCLRPCFHRQSRPCHKTFPRCTYSLGSFIGCRKNHGANGSAIDRREHILRLARCFHTVNQRNGL